MIASYTLKFFFQAKGQNTDIEIYRSTDKATVTDPANLWSTVPITHTEYLFDIHRPEDVRFYWHSVRAVGAEPSRFSDPIYAGPTMILAQKLARRISSIRVKNLLCSISM